MSKFDDFKVPSGINVAAVRLIKSRNERMQRVEEGMLPRTSELLSGYPFAAGDIDIDITSWCKHRLLLGAGDRLEAALENLKVSHSVESCRLVLGAGEGELGDDLDRVRLYAVCLGDHKSLFKLRRDLEDRVAMSGTLSFSTLISRTMLEGMSGMFKNPVDAYARGARRIRESNDIANLYLAAEKWVTNGEYAEVEAAESMIREALAAEREDRAETAPPTSAGIVVVPELPDGGTSHRREIHRAWTGIAGSKIPLIAKGNIVAARQALVARWPHAFRLIDTILSDLVVSETVLFRPTCIVGKPGSGKTALAKAISEMAGLPVEVVPLGGVSDASLMGTSAQWSSARESVPLQLIRRSGSANPALVWDELEKVSTATHNGSALDALLPMLERTQSRSVRDPALEVECDLSHVSHFATANSLEGVPGPLRDRMRILKMPDPEWKHLGLLAENIVNDLMLQRGLDGRWVAPLAPDEIALIKKTWPGGSLRQLTRIIETLVDGREMTWGNA
ncbi:hypothetical protein ASE94_01855 [Devosia sp. Leaf64]|nr:hypothetical protein ASE94_01855 [Devosia sp. Leaf64]